MKKLTTLMLGLGLILGTTAVFADDAPAKPTKEKKAKKSKTKKTDQTEKKS